MSVGVVFVHCGLHKTGTTAIQNAFHQHRQLLDTHGVLYPCTGDEEYGHHNLAWEITGDRRFNPNALTITKVVAQIAAFDGVTVLSSEDFESVLHQPAGLALLVQPLRAIGVEVCLVVYFRKRKEYAVSLYAEMLAHGYPGTFDKFAKEVRSTGQFRFCEWTFQFDYRRVRATLKGEPDICLTQRHYGATMQSCSVVPDFLMVVGLPTDLFEEAASSRRNERQLPAQALSRLIANRAGRPLSELENDTIHRLLHLTGAETPLPLDRVCSARTIAAIEALTSLPDAQAENALVAWWQGRLLTRLRRFAAGVRRRLTALSQGALSAVL